MNGTGGSADDNPSRHGGPGGLLRRLIYASPFYGATLGRGGDTLRGTPSDPWTGDRQAGAALTEGTLTTGSGPVAIAADPWAQPPAGDAALSVLHGFDWLRDLRALGNEAARETAVRLTAGWLTHYEGWSPDAWRTDLIGSRLSAWLGNFAFLRAAGPEGFAGRVLRTTARQSRHLTRAAHEGPADYRRFRVIKGLIHAGVCLSSQDRALKAGLALLDAEVPRQVLPDGGHAQRCPAIHLAVLRDLIDIRAALITGHVEIPVTLQTGIDRMTPMLRTWRHGDSRLAVFNDGNEADEALVHTVLALSGARGRAPQSAPHTGFQRVAAGRTLVLFDGGAPPPPGLDTRAHAGPLAFELSVGKDRMIVNCGAGDDGGEWFEAMRGTAAHSTLAVNDVNAAEIRPEGLGRRPSAVTCQRREADGHVMIEASHDGYAAPFGLIHQRLLYIAGDGGDLRGEDRITRSESRRRARGDSGGVAYTVRFHLHPDVRASLTGDGASVLLRLPAGGGWRFRADRRPVLEDSIYLGAGRPARKTRQIVLRGPVAAAGATVKWRLAREG